MIILRLLFAFLLMSFASPALTQITYFVDQQNGSATNNGRSLATPFASMNTAVALVNAGDTIAVVGTHTNPSYNATYTYTNADNPHLWHSENTIRINNLHGTPNAYITIKAHNAATLLKGDGANIFRVQNSSFLRIEGFNIQGEVSNIPLATANALQFVYIKADSVGNPKAPTAAELQYRDLDCISNCTSGAVVDGEIYSSLDTLNITRPSYIDTRGLYLSNVHHIEIYRNTIHDMPGGGLRVSDCEDILIEGNEVYACSRKSYSGTHALVVTKATSSRVSNDYRITIIHNKIHHNYNEQYSWAPTKTIVTPHIDEGKGISLQRNETTYNANGTIKVNWEHGRILVQNNLCYFNGFSGIHSNDGHRIDIINNTCYFNSYTKSIPVGFTTNNGGNIGISAQGGSDVKIINNISIIDTALSKSAIASNISPADSLVVEHNIIYGTSLSGTMGPIRTNATVDAIQVNTQMVDPLFVDPVNFDFRLQANSPAIDAAQSSTAPPLDFFYTPRDNAPDIGAVEYSAILSTLPIKLSTAPFRCYPNPVEYRLFVEGANVAPSTVAMYNLLGQDFSAAILVQDQSILMSALPTGMYVLQIGAFSQLVYKK